MPRAASLRVATCLAPHLCWFYRFLARYLGRRLGQRTEFLADVCYEQLAEVDIAFVCSLAYVEHPAIGRRFEPLAAPVISGARYANQAVYYSDVIVRRDSTLTSFADLRGRSWAYNEKYSQSGYGITRYHLARLGETCGYFGRVLDAGRHERAIRLVADGQVDAAAIDSHTLETYLALYPDLARALRVIDSLGPSPIQPVVVRRGMDAGCKEGVRAALGHLEHDPGVRFRLARASVKRFVPVEDRTYEPIRTMRAVAVAAGLSVLG
jgi:phosphonate transport system substrate-binding protein